MTFQFALKPKQENKFINEKDYCSDTLMTAISSSLGHALQTFKEIREQENYDGCAR